MNERRRFLQMLGGGAVAAGMGCGGGASSNPGAGGAGGAGGGPASSSSRAAASSSGGTGGAAASSSSGTGGMGTGDSTGTGATCGGGGASSDGTNSDACSSDRGVFNMGKPADFAAVGLYKSTNLASNAMIGRDAAGLYAMSSLCTHQCCDLNATQQGFAYGTFTTLDGEKVIQCNCHGSMFAYDGTVVQGPAGSDLQHWQLDLGCDGILYADTTKPIARTVRLVT